MQSNKQGKRVKLSYTAAFDVLKRKTVFLDVVGVVGRLGYLKRFLQALPLPLPAGFLLLAFWLLARFFRSSALTESLARLT